MRRGIPRRLDRGVGRVGGWLRSAARRSISGGGRAELAAPPPRRQRRSAALGVRSGKAWLARTRSCRGGGSWLEAGRGSGAAKPASSASAVRAPTRDRPPTSRSDHRRLGFLLRPGSGLDDAAEDQARCRARVAATWNRGAAPLRVAACALPPRALGVLVEVDRGGAICRRLHATRFCCSGRAGQGRPGAGGQAAREVGDGTTSNSEIPLAL